MMSATLEGRVPGRFTASAERLQRDVERLAEFGRVGPTAITRLAFTDADNAAHAFIEGLMRDAGLETRYDAFGNLFGERRGRDSGAAPVVTGSHVDGPPNGGIYDGVIGVLCGIEACRAMNESGHETRRAVQVVAVRSEHLDRFGISCLGGRALGGKLKPADLERLKDENGMSLRQVLAECGFAPDRLDSVSLRGRIRAWIELHVEQGRVLEDAGRRVGVVTAIAGPTRYKVRVRGMADHSGATPMSLRRDALCGAAEIVLDLERLARGTRHCVGTVGIIRAEPGAVHTIPGAAEFFVDIRGVDRDEKARLVADFRKSMHERCAARGLDLSFETFVDEAPVPCSPWLVSALDGLCQELNAEHLVMPSGAGHDSQHVAAAADVGMLFIPSVRGIAHTPEEFTEPADLAHGAEILAEALARLADDQMAPSG